MKVLVTGGLGNIGSNVIDELTKLQYDIVVFDKKTKKTMKIHKKLSKKFNYILHWGDITKSETITPALKGIDAIIHLAAILSPVSERIPKIAYQVNVLGTKNLVSEAKKVNPEIHFVFSSSFAVYGPRMEKNPPIKVNDPFNLTDNYSHHKAEAEQIISESSLRYTFIRFGAVLPLDIVSEGIDPFAFDIPLDQRIHFIHHKDAARALVHAVDRKTYNKIYLGGGGDDCSLIQGDLLKRSLTASGMGMFPEKAFKKAKKPEDYIYFDWMDTRESERELQFQQLTYEDYVQDLKNFLGWKRFFAHLFSPLVKYFILRKSPYLKEEQ